MINQLIKIKRMQCLYLLTSDIETYRLSIVFKKDLDKNMISTRDELNIFQIIQVPLEASITKKQTSSELQL